MGWTEACNLNKGLYEVTGGEKLYQTHCNFGKLCTRRCTSLPAFWRLRSSPISCGDYKMVSGVGDACGHAYQVEITIPRLKRRTSGKRGPGGCSGTYKLLCLRPSDNVGGDTLELPQRRHRTPPTQNISAELQNCTLP